MSSSPAPHLALSDAALTLIRHAEVDMAERALPEGPPARILTNALGASTDPAVWRREAAVIRLISVIEAYVDAVSMHRMARLVDSSGSLVALLVQDFETASSGSWQNRHDTYLSYHGLSLRSLSGWQAIKAGIEVRNCLLHGLGSLTAKQRGQTKLAASLRPIDVTIGANRMHLSILTVSKIAEGSDRFVADLDATISLTPEP
jgi:hypothetical protein